MNRQQLRVPRTETSVAKQLDMKSATLQFLSVALSAGPRNEATNEYHA